MSVTHDYDLILLCKKQDEAAMLSLYKAYDGLVKKFYKGFRIHHPLSGLDLNDYQQEAYFAFCKAIKYIDLAKIDRPESWLFLGYYVYALKNLNARLAKRATKSLVAEDSIDSIFDGEGYIDQENYAALATNDTASDMGMQAFIYDTFMGALSEDEKKVVVGKMQLNTDNKEKTLKEIAKEMGSNYAYVYRKLMSAKQIYEKLCSG